MSFSRRVLRRDPAPLQGKLVDAGNRCVSAQPAAVKALHGRLHLYAVTVLWHAGEPLAAEMSSHRSAR